MGAFDYRNTDVKPFVNFLTAFLGGTPGAGGVPCVNTNPKPYIDAEFGELGADPASGYVNANPRDYIDAMVLTIAEPDPPDTTAPNTTITDGPSGTVNYANPTFTFTSSEPSSTFETKMDSDEWEAATSPKVYSDLADGAHAFQVRATDAAGNTDASPASQAFTIDTSIPPIWTQIRDLSSYEQWDGVLDSAPGSSITDVSDYIYIYQPNQGERCELQVNDGRLIEGAICRYTWDVYITSDTVLDSSGSGQDTICQQHGNNQAGYGGGLTIRESDDELILRVKGGTRLSESGAQRYEYESDGNGGGADGLGIGTAEPAENVECGTITRDTWHTIQVEALWSKEWTGYVYVTLNDGDPVGVEDVPTFCSPSDRQLFRVGWYSSGGPVPKKMRVRDCKIEVPA